MTSMNKVAMLDQHNFLLFSAVDSCATDISQSYIYLYLQQKTQIGLDIY